MTVASLMCLQLANQQSIRHRVIGVGSVTRALTAAEVVKQVSAFVLGSLVLRVHEI